MSARVFIIMSCTMIALSGCVTVEGFCAAYQRKDLTDPGLRMQNRHNKEADRVNELTARKRCE